jgi:hypothetical protein
MPIQFGKEIAAISLEELQFAMVAADAAYSRKMPTESMETRTRPIQVGEQVVRLTDKPFNHAAVAILDALRHDREKAPAALYRIMIIGSAVFEHDDFKNWARIGADGKEEAHRAILDAVATIPVIAGEEVTPAAVFRLAEQIKAQIGDE